MQLTGIENENEFYPAGFFSGALEDELTQVVSRWSANAGDGNNPSSRLSSCTASYFSAMSRARTMSDRTSADQIRLHATHSLLSALGYDYQRQGLELAGPGNLLVPSIARVADANGRDTLWVLEAPLPDRDDLSADPLGMPFRTEQFATDEVEFAGVEESIEELLGRGVFSLRHPPRYVLVLGLSQIVLIDRNKWQSRSVLRFDLAEIFERREKDTINAMACFISREALAPETGVPVADRLEEEAQRHANAVTSSLKSTVRDAIELLGQEVLDVTGGKHPSGPLRDTWIDGKALSLESLRFMYRLLFLFYAEANPKLGVLDLRDSVYATGYSLEALRELESVRLRTKDEREGTYLWDSLKTLLDLMYSGNDQVFRLPAVKVSLLDPGSTPILSSVRLRNETIQKVIRLLSLKRARSGTSRISYAQLGIGQLGAVYETLISFTGFVAKTDLIELRPKTGRGGEADEGNEDAEPVDGDADDNSVDEDAFETNDTAARSDRVDLLAPSYFVPKSRASEFRPDEVVYAGTEPKVYPKGTFVYRLAGRDREKSASYYTPEPLARLLVKHALMERCKDMPADEILNLKVLEPAMGSAAFLVETTNQLSDLYLARKQEETGQTIPQEEYFLERQKVRAFIADRNCFGVDLNPIAVELGAISLWLNSLHNSDFSPWFGDQLHAGNSLIGARRASYDQASLRAKKKDDLWLNQKPAEHGWKQALPGGHIWQFLLPAKDMAKFDIDKSISDLAGNAQVQIKEWRKGGFFAAMQPHEIKLLLKLSKVVETLFGEVARDIAKSRADANDEITLWPNKVMQGVQGEDFRDKERRRRVLLGDDHASNTLPYKRLKTAMDAWCALWFWPLDKADLLPSRTEFLHGMAMILEGGFMPDGSLSALSMDEFADPAPDFFDKLEPGSPAKDLFASAQSRQQGLFRETDVDSLVQEVDWLSVAVEVATRERFTHFDLIFADVLKSRGGFDIIVGNPPWAKPTFDEALLVTELDASIGSRGLKANTVRNNINAHLTGDAEKKFFLAGYVREKGRISATSSEVMFPHLGAGSNNLYACFIDTSFKLSSPNGVVGLVHQDRHLTDPKGGEFRAEWYLRIRKHFAFRNEIRQKNFSDIGNRKEFSVNIYGPPGTDPDFFHMSNILLPSQVEDSFAHDGAGDVKPVRYNSGWITEGHKNRIISLNRDVLLRLNAREPHDTTPIHEKLPQIYSIGVLESFVALGAARKSSCTPRFSIEGRLVETTGIGNGALKKREVFSADLSNVVLTAPMIKIGSAFSQAPNVHLSSHRDYTSVDFSLVNSATQIRFGYEVIDGDRLRSILGTPESLNGKTQHDPFKIAARDFIDVNGERSFLAGIIPSRMQHLHTIRSIQFENIQQTLNFFAECLSIPIDFALRTMAPGHLDRSVIEAIPFVELPEDALARALLLVCHVKELGDLWNSQARKLNWGGWSHEHPSLPQIYLDTEWSNGTGLVTEYSRRAALVEIDVIVARTLGLELSQLIDIYKFGYPILRQNEAGTWYDRHGRIVWSCSDGLPGVGFFEGGKKPSAKRWEQIVASGVTELHCEKEINYMDGARRVHTSTFVGPFKTCDRIEDYTRAWAHFEERGGAA